ncbi:MAG: nucleotidyltransferase family protein, partial [Bacteroidaceae bacterium]|nr:nucleotidyltransferase family protein [Bacteroidaceae bacterium]
GDIDIYTYSADKNQMTDEEAHHQADEIILSEGAIMDDSPSKKHCKFGIYGVTFENHRMFLHVAECQTTVKAEQWLQRHISTSSVELLGGKCHIEVPSIAFDSVFIPLHAAQHYGEGLSLKHLCDWAILVKQYGLTLPSELDDKYFKQSVSALTHLCNQYLGLSVPVDADNRLADEMMQEILYPPYYGKTPSGGKGKQYLFQLRNRIHIFRLTHRLLGVSFGGKVRGWCMRKIKEFYSRYK